jgi:hypothetical protein
VTSGTPEPTASTLWLPAASRNAKRESEFIALSCVPTATRTRYLLLRRHFRSIVMQCQMSPAV